jgi:acetyl esterase/lipase
MVEFIKRGAICVTVEYSLAPEHPDPAALEDCYAGLIYLVDHAAGWNVDPERILIAGVSAGGGLAAGVALYARDHAGPTLRGQLLLAPMLDDRADPESTGAFSSVGIWSEESNRTGWRARLGDIAGGPLVSPYSAPARAETYVDLPPAYLEVGSAELFRDEVVRFAQGIWRDGGSAELHVWAGAFHGFDFFAPSAWVTGSALETRRRWVVRLLAL